MIKPVNSDLITFCQKIIANPHKVAILDTETTGFKGEIIDLSIIDPNGNVLYNSLLKPQCFIEASAKAVHHIDETMVSHAPTFADEWAKISEAIKGRIIIAYNAEFDYGRFIYTAKVHGVSLPESTWQCMMLAYASYFDAPPKYPDNPQPAWQKLENACHQQGIDIGQQEHRALSDTLATLALIKRIAQLGPSTRKYSDASTHWETTISLQDALKSQPQGQDNAVLKVSDTFQGIDNNASDLHRSAKQTMLFFPEQTKPVLGKCTTCDKDATRSSPSGTLYCEQCGRCHRKVYGVMKGVVVVYEECKVSVEDFVMHPRLGIYTCPCLLKFDEDIEACKRGQKAS